MYHTKLFLFFLTLLLIKQPTSAATELDSAFLEHFAKTYLLEKFPSTDEKKVLISVTTSPLQTRQMLLLLIALP